MIIQRDAPRRPFARFPAPYYIAAPIDPAPPTFPVLTREEHPRHGQEAFGTPETVPPFRIRAGTRRVVLPHPAMRRTRSQCGASEGVVRRHHALSRGPLRRPG